MDTHMPVFSKVSFSSVDFLSSIEYSIYFIGKVVADCLSFQLFSFFFLKHGLFGVHATLID